jgi:hypothetical protein
MMRISPSFLAVTVFLTRDLGGLSTPSVINALKWVFEPVPERMHVWWVMTSLVT